MRLLHARYTHDDECVSRGKHLAQRRRSARGAVGQSVPLHRLPEHRRCRDDGGDADAGLTAMSTRTFGEPIRRNEDRRLLTGQALFIDDVELPGMLHAAFLRSQVAHARILKIDVSKALQRPGVFAAYVAGDLGDYWQPGPILVPPPPIPGIVFNKRTQLPLAKPKLRHVVEPLVIVIAESRYIAEDALHDIDVELEGLPAVVGLERGLNAGSALVHEDVGPNVPAHVRQTKGHYPAAAAKADR